jgi:hypothetical protein
MQFFIYLAITDLNGKIEARILPPKCDLFITSHLALLYKEVVFICQKFVPHYDV